MGDAPIVIWTVVLITNVSSANGRNASSASFHHTRIPFIPFPKQATGLLDNQYPLVSQLTSAVFRASEIKPILVEIARSGLAFGNSVASALRSKFPYLSFFSASFSNPLLHSPLLSCIVEDGITLHWLLARSFSSFLPDS